MRYLAQIMFHKIGSLRLRRVFAGAIAIACTFLCVSVTAAHATEIRHVNLSFNNPDIKFIDADHWVIPIRSNGSAKSPKDTGACQGTYLTPELVAVGTATAVSYGTKYFCTEPVDYNITAGVYYVVNSGQEDDAGSTHDSGVSQQPYVSGISYLCSNNDNGGWQPYDYSTVHGISHSGTGNTVTVGCQFLG